MSAESKQFMDAAIEAHFASESEGALVSGYVLQIFGSSIDDLEEHGTRTLREVAEGQNFITSMGIGAYMQTTLKGSLFEDIDDDD